MLGFCGSQRVKQTRNLMTPTQIKFGLHIVSGFAVAAALTCFVSMWYLDTASLKQPTQATGIYLYPHRIKGELQTHYITKNQYLISEYGAYGFFVAVIALMGSQSLGQRIDRKTSD